LKRFVVFLAVALSVAFAAVAFAATVQKLNATATPNNLPQHQRANVALKISESTTTTDADGIQPPVTAVRILLDKDYKITTAGLPRCHESRIDGQSASEAKQTCAGAFVGEGTAQARVGVNGQPVDINAVVTAFNGVPDDDGAYQGVPVMLLHVDLGATQVFVLLHVKRVNRGEYGVLLKTFPGPSEPIRRLTLELKRNYRAGGEVRHYVSARCSDGRLNYTGTFSYEEGPDRTVTKSQRCRNP
jgi:hypothetical protein